LRVGFREDLFGGLDPDEGWERSFQMSIRIIHASTGELIRELTLNPAVD
jgi:hypothetical protein